LKRIESQAIHALPFPVMIPSTVLFLAFDAVDMETELTFADASSCPEFDRWLQLRKLAIVTDFRRIVRVGSGLSCLEAYMLNGFAFEKGPIINQSSGGFNQLYQRIDDQFSIAVKSFFLPKWIEKSDIENYIENLINLRHPCISTPIGFIFSGESAEFWELKIVRLYSEGCSLEEVISTNPIWWTPTVKAKVIVGIVMCLRFAHSLGLMHSTLNVQNILFDSDHRIQISDFGLVGLEMAAMENEAKQSTLKTDIYAFVSILFHMVVGHPVKSESSVLTDIPEFISLIIEEVLSPQSTTIYSFQNIFQILKLNDFQIVEGVDSAEVLEFVNWIESEEYPEK
jgi:serine/threonine protein kinase